MEKVSWSGRVVSVQPRIRLLRSFDERGHSYLGYCLIVDGTIGNESREFSVGIGKVAQQKHQFQVGDKAGGNSVPVADARREPVEFYRASKLKVLQRSSEKSWDPPPWHGVTPDLETYQWRGHRRLSARTYNSRCQSCIWGCRMAVEMIIDPWNPKMRYRFETFCYGPKSCGYYKAGPRRIVPGRKGMRWEEPDWVDEQETAHRSMDE
jgi:hypothetical protein